MNTKESNKKFAFILFIILILLACGCTALPNNSAEHPASEVGEQAHSTSNNIESNDGIKSVEIDYTPKQRIITDINNLLDCDIDTVERYFGKSDVYIPEMVADRVSVAKITFTSITDEDGNSLLPITPSTPVEMPSSEENNAEGTNDDIDAVSPDKSTSVNLPNPTEVDKSLDDVQGVENGSLTVTIHICTIDYSKTKDAIDKLSESIKAKDPFITKEKLDEQVTNEIAARATNGEFDLHITIPVVVQYNSGVSEVKLTEQFKAALTGGWYNPTGLKLESGTCPLAEILKQQYEEAVNSKDTD